MRRLILLLLALLLPGLVAAQGVVTSSAPEKVSVSVYRDPERGGGGELHLATLSGFALISETRTIDLPAGEAEVRFEGVADGMIAVSAIVTGLPGGTVEKNRDAALLSPASLVDGSLGNRVMLRRTDRATGAVRDEDPRLLLGLVFGAFVGLFYGDYFARAHKRSGAWCSTYQGRIDIDETTVARSAECAWRLLAAS